MKNDNELIKKFQNGDNAAFDYLVREHLDEVYGFFVKITDDPMDAEDLAQDVFLKLHKSLKNSVLSLNLGLTYTESMLMQPITIYAAADGASGSILMIVTNRSMTIPEQNPIGLRRSCGMLWQNYPKHNELWSRCV